MTNKEPLEIHKRPTTKPANNQQPTIGYQQLANEASLEIHKAQTINPTNNQTNNHGRSRHDKQIIIGHPQKTNNQPAKNQQPTIGDQLLANEAPLEIHKTQNINPTSCLTNNHGRSRHDKQRTIGAPQKTNNQTSKQPT